MPRRAAPAVAALFAVALALTGCFGSSPGPGAEIVGGAPSGQSTEQACALVTDRMQAALEEFGDLETTQDPETLSSAMQAAADAIGDVIRQVDNPEVAEAAAGVRDAYEAVAEFTADEGAADEGAEGELAAEYQEALTAFAMLCPSGN